MIYQHVKLLHTLELDDDVHMVSLYRHGTDDMCNIIYVRIWKKN